MKTPTHNQQTAMHRKHPSQNQTPTTLKSVIRELTSTNKQLASIFGTLLSSQESDALREFSGLFRPDLFRGGFFKLSRRFPPSQIRELFDVEGKWIL